MLGLGTVYCPTGAETWLGAYVFHSPPAYSSCLSKSSERSLRRYTDLYHSYSAR